MITLLPWRVMIEAELAHLPDSDQALNEWPKCSPLASALSHPAPHLVGSKCGKRKHGLPRVEMPALNAISSPFPFN